MSTEKKPARRIVLRNVRLAFPALFEPKSVNNEGEPAFSASFIIPAKDPQIAKVNALIEQVAKDKWGAKAAEVMKTIRAKDMACLHDGDTKSEYDGYAGNKYISARSKGRPLIVDRDKTPLVAGDGRPYAGCYVMTEIELWAQDNQYGKRVNATLCGVQFFRDGDAFAGGRPSSPDAFEDLSDTGEEAAVEESLAD